MIAKPINNILQAHFQKLVATGIKKAETKYAEFSAKLRDADHFYQLKNVVEELASVESIISESEYPFYIENHSSENYLLNQFSSRTFLLNVDESEQLEESVSWGHYRSLLWENETKLKEEIPSYSYADFLKGKVDTYFANFEKHFNLPKEDYFKIRNWQAQNLIEIITAELQPLIKEIQVHCNTLTNPQEFLISEQALIEELSNTEPNSDAIKSLLAQMFIFSSNSDLTKYDDSLLSDNYTLCGAGKINWKFLFPEHLNPLIKKIKTKDLKLFPTELTVFFVLDKLSVWLKEVMEGKPVQQTWVAPDFDTLFEKIKTDADNRVKELTQQISTQLETPGISDPQAKKYLIDNLDIYRRKFNSFVSKYLFSFMKEEKNEWLKENFIINSFFGNDTADQMKDITEAMVIHKMAWEIIGLHIEVFLTHRIDYPGKSSSHLEIMALMNQMVLDKELYNALEKSMDDFMMHFESSFLPMEIHFQNQKLLMTDLFQKSLDRLQTHLNQSDSSNKILFLQSRLKHLRQREIQLKQFDGIDGLQKHEQKYSKLFKEFLEIEADFIRETKDINFTNVLPTSKPALQLSAASSVKTKTAKISIKKFDDIPEKKAAFLLKMMEDLSITNNGESQLGPRGANQIRVVVEAAIEKNILPRRIFFFTKLIGDKINHPVSKPARPKDFDALMKSYKAYIDSHYQV